MVFKLYILAICYIPIIEIFLPKTNFGSGIPDLDAARVSLYLLVMLFFVHGAAKKNLKLFSKWGSNLVIFSILILFSVAWSQESYNVQTLADIFDSVFIPLFIALIALNIFREEKMVDAFIKHLCFAVFILSVISLYKMIFLSHIGFSGNDSVRSAGFGHLGNPNGLAIFLVLSIPCILYAIRKKIIRDKVGWLILFSVFGGVLCTVSRKGMITMLISTLLFFFLTKQFKKIVVFCFIAIATVCALAGVQNVSSRFEKQDIQHQFSGKANMAIAGLKMFVSSPVIGKGFKGYYNNWKYYFPTSGVEKYRAHNIYVTAIANYGAIGFVLFMFIFLYPLFISVKILRFYEDEKKYEHLRNMAIICISSVVPFMISGYFAGGLFYSAVKITLLYTIMSFMLAGYTEVKNQRTKF